MSQSRILKREVETVKTIQSLTGVFENIASVQVRVTRRKVLSAKLFFNDMWEVYSQLRVMADEQSRSVLGKLRNGRHLSVVVTSPIGLSGDIDDRVIQLFEQADVSNDKDNDTLVVGSHGVQLLTQRGFELIRSFEVPDITKPFDVSPLSNLVQEYESASLYYVSYVSLTVQKAAVLSLLGGAQTLTQEEKALLKKGEVELISPDNFIFEPSILEVIDSLETAMLTTTFNQILLESRLAQLANRFTTMTSARQRATETRKKVFLEFLGARRNEKDEITRQIMAAVRAL